MLMYMPSKNSRATVGAPAGSRTEALHFPGRRSLANDDLAPVDERLIQAESRAELLNGRLLFSPPADEPHGREHFSLVWLLGAHVTRGYLGAVDMLTRTSKKSDFAPDASIYPEERDPDTGGRKLEELAFEIVSKQRLDVATNKACELSKRGVRRLFCISLEERQVMEWSHDTRRWQPLADHDLIEDRCLVRPLPVRTLLHAAGTDDAVALALLDKETPVLKKALADSRQKGRDEGLVAGARRNLSAVLAARATIAACDALPRLEEWLARAAIATRIDEVL
jgi:Uma2 family endonuclease